MFSGGEVGSLCRWFLTDEQAAGYARFTGPPSLAELERFCFLDDADLRLVNKRRVDGQRLGFAVQLATVRYLGTFLADPLDVPTVLVEFLAGQLQVADPSCVKQYVERRVTRFEHQREIAAAGDGVRRGARGAHAVAG